MKRCRTTICCTSPTLNYRIRSYGCIGSRSSISAGRSTPICSGSNATIKIGRGMPSTISRPKYSPRKHCWRTAYGHSSSPDVVRPALLPQARPRPAGCAEHRPEPLLQGRLRGLPQRIYSRAEAARSTLRGCGNGGRRSSFPPRRTICRFCSKRSGATTHRAPARCCFLLANEYFPPLIRGEVGTAPAPRRLRACDVLPR